MKAFLVGFNSDMLTFLRGFLTRCCKRVFLYQGKNSAIIHLSCLPCSSKVFGVAELASTFYILKNLSSCWFVLGGLSLKMASFTFHLHWYLSGPHIESTHDQPPYANSTLGINCRPFISLILCDRIMKLTYWWLYLKSIVVVYKC